jgi:hypothetical protein
MIFGSMITLNLKIPKQHGPWNALGFDQCFLVIYLEWNVSF